MVLIPGSQLWDLCDQKLPIVLISPIWRCNTFIIPNNIWPENLEAADLWTCWLLSTPAFEDDWNCVEFESGHFLFIWIMHVYL